MRLATKFGVEARTTPLPSRVVSGFEAIHRWGRVAAMIRRGHVARRGWKKWDAAKNWAAAPPAKRLGSPLIDRPEVLDASTAPGVTTKGAMRARSFFQSIRSAMVSMIRSQPDNSSRCSP